MIYSSFIDGLNFISNHIDTGLKADPLLINQQQFACASVKLSLTKYRMMEF